MTIRCRWRSPVCTVRSRQHGRRAQLRAALRPHGRLLGERLARHARLRPDSGPSSERADGRRARARQRRRGRRRRLLHVRPTRERHRLVLGRRRARRGGGRHDARDLLRAEHGRRHHRRRRDHGRPLPPCALRAGGTAACWGGSDPGQDDGGLPDSALPVPIAGVSGAVAIRAGGDSTYALRPDGSILAWGVGDAHVAHPAPAL